MEISIGSIIRNPAEAIFEQGVRMGFDAGMKSQRYNAETMFPEISRVIFNDPATVIYWEDGTKSVVKAQNEKFDPEKGFAMACLKKMCGNTSKYFDLVKEYCPQDDEK